jgi:hypothetical protein
MSALPLDPDDEPPVRVDAPDELASVAIVQVGLVTTEQARAAGVTDRRISTLVRRGRWRRVTRGVLDARIGPLHEVPWNARRRRAAWAGLLAYGPEAVAVGTSALALLRVAGLPTTITSEVALPGGSDRRSRDGLRLRQFDDGMTTIEVAGRLVADPRWALAQAVPELSRRRALAVLDSSLHRKLLRPSELLVAHELARGRRGVARTHLLWELADARAGSPLESFGRLDCVDAGIPPDVLQLPLDDSPYPERGDLGWYLGDDRWLVAEIDGEEVHSAPVAVYADRARQNRMVSTGRFIVLRFTNQDLDGVISQTVLRTLRRLRRRGGTE